MLQLKHTTTSAGEKESSISVALPRQLKPGCVVIVHGCLTGCWLSAALAAGVEDAAAGKAGSSLRVQLVASGQFEAAHHGPGGALLAMEAGTACPWEAVGRTPRREFSLTFAIGELFYEISSSVSSQRRLAQFHHMGSFAHYRVLLLTGDADFRQVECQDGNSTLHFGCFYEVSPKPGGSNATTSQKLWRCRLSLPRVERPLKQPLPGREDLVQGGSSANPADSQLTLKLSISVGSNGGDGKGQWVGPESAAPPTELLVKLRVSLDEDADPLETTNEQVSPTMLAQSPSTQDKWSPTKTAESRTNEQVSPTMLAQSYSTHDKWSPTKTPESRTNEQVSPTMLAQSYSTQDKWSPTKTAESRTNEQVSPTMLAQSLSTQDKWSPTKTAESRTTSLPVSPSTEQIPSPMMDESLSLEHAPLSNRDEVAKEPAQSRLFESQPAQAGTVADAICSPRNESPELCKSRRPSRGRASRRRAAAGVAPTISPFVCKAERTTPRVSESRTPPPEKPASQEDGVPVEDAFAQTVRKEIGAIGVTAQPPSRQSIECPVPSQQLDEPGKAAVEDQWIEHVQKLSRSLDGASRDASMSIEFVAKESDQEEKDEPPTEPEIASDDVIATFHAMPPLSLFQTLDRTENRLPELPLNVPVLPSRLSAAEAGQFQVRDEPTLEKKDITLSANLTDEASPAQGEVEARSTEHDITLSTELGIWPPADADPSSESEMELELSGFEEHLSTATRPKVYNESLHMELDPEKLADQAVLAEALDGKVLAISEDQVQNETLFAAAALDETMSTEIDSPTLVDQVWGKSMSELALASAVTAEALHETMSTEPNAPTLADQFWDKTFNELAETTEALDENISMTFDDEARDETLSELAALARADELAVDENSIRAASLTLSELAASAGIDEQQAEDERCSTHSVTSEVAFTIAGHQACSRELQETSHHKQHEFIATTQIEPAMAKPERLEDSPPIFDEYRQLAVSLVDDILSKLLAPATTVGDNEVGEKNPTAGGGSNSQQTSRSSSFEELRKLVGAEQPVPSLPASEDPLGNRYSAPVIAKFTCSVFRNGHLVKERSAQTSSASAVTEKAWDTSSQRMVAVTRVSQPSGGLQLSHPVCEVWVTAGNMVTVRWRDGLAKEDAEQLSADAPVVGQTLHAPSLSSVGLDLSASGCEVVVNQTYNTALPGESRTNF